MNKYKNKKTVYNGITFDSMGEAGRYAELSILLQVRRIDHLETQKSFVLQPAFICNEKKIRPITYIADFYYYDCDLARYVIEDFKGVETPEFRIKWKMLQFLYSDKYIYNKSGKRYKK